MSELQHGQVTIGDLYREIIAMRTDIARALIRIEVLDTRTGGAETARQDHEIRLRVLEAFKWKLTGIALCVAIVCGLLSGFLTAVIRGGR